MHSYTQNETRLVVYVALEDERPQLAHAVFTEIGSYKNATENKSKVSWLWLRSHLITSVHRFRLKRVCFSTKINSNSARYVCTSILRNTHFLRIWKF